MTRIVAALALAWAALIGGGCNRTDREHQICAEACGRAGGTEVPVRRGRRIDGACICKTDDAYTIIVLPLGTFDGTACDGGARGL